MSVSLLLIHEKHTPFDADRVEEMLRAIDGVTDVARRTTPTGAARLIARVERSGETCELWVDDGGGSMHLTDPGSIGIDLARSLNSAFEALSLGSLEAFDQAYTFHVRLRDGVNLLTSHKTDGRN